MNNPGSTDDRFIGESGKPVHFTSSPSYSSPSSNSSQAIKTTYKEILAGAKLFFDNNVNRFDEHNRFFERFIPEWTSSLDQGKYNYAELIWEAVLDEALVWENSMSERIHKGAPYYYWGVTCILKEDLEKGFLLMHQALEEDKKSAALVKFQNAPSYTFVTLDYLQQKQLFYDKVKEIANFLEIQLSSYRMNRSGSLMLLDFKSKLLSTMDPVLLEIVYLLIFDVFHFHKMIREYDKNLTNNSYGYLSMANRIFSFCLIIDNLITNKKPTLKDQRFPVVVNYLASFTSLKLTQDMVQQFNEPFQNNFSNTLSSIITSAIPPNMPQIIPASIEEDLIVVYGFRNLGAHRIENLPIINTYFREIIARIFNIVFFVVDRLY